ncbi:creatininase [Methylocystaceae bacterium]|nr:creatininase [Methylocystaceae bacterium]
MLSSRFWSDLSLHDFQSGSLPQAIAVLPIAAIEQHGPHLPFGVDAMIMEGCLNRALMQMPETLATVFLPIQKIGVSLEHRDFAGSLSLSSQTAARMLFEISESVARTGIKKLILMNSHGGNSAVLSQLALELRAHFNLLAVTCSWSRFGYPQGLFDAEEVRLGIHGGDIETSLMLALRPELVDQTKAKNFTSAALNYERDFIWLRADRPAGFGWMAQDLSSAGAVGDASKASAAKGEAVINYWASAFIELIRDVERFDLSNLRNAP